MKLIVDDENTGCTLECCGVVDALTKLKGIIPPNAQNVRVEIEAPELYGDMDGATPVTPEPGFGKDIERRTVTALVEQLELLRELAKTRCQTMGMEENARLTHAMCNLSGKIHAWMSEDAARLRQSGIRTQRKNDGSFFMDRHAKLPLAIASLAFLASAASLILRLLTV